MAFVSARPGLPGKSWVNRSPGEDHFFTRARGGLFQGKESCHCTEERGTRICYFMAACSPWPHQCWLSHHFISLGAKEKAGRRLVKGTTLLWRLVRERSRVSVTVPLQPPRQGAEGREGAVVSPWHKTVLPWTQMCPGFKCLPARPDFSGLYYSSQEEAAWTWHLPCNLGTSWKAVITYHIVITQRLVITYHIVITLPALFRLEPLLPWVLFLNPSSVLRNKTKHFKWFLDEHFSPLRTFTYSMLSFERLFLFSLAIRLFF